MKLPKRSESHFVYACDSGARLLKSEFVPDGEAIFEEGEPWPTFFVCIAAGASPTLVDTQLKHALEAFRADPLLERERHHFTQVYEGD